VNAAFKGDGSPLIVAARRAIQRQLNFCSTAAPILTWACRGTARNHYGCPRGSWDVVTLLLDSRASIDRVVPGDENALIQASGAGQLSVVKLLVSHGADVNARVWVEPDSVRPNGEWRTPLNMARKGGHSAVVDFLISAGARD